MSSWRSGPGDQFAHDRAPLSKVSGKAFLAILLAAVLSFSSMVGWSSAGAKASTPGISVDVNLGNDQYNGKTVVTENQNLSMTVQYDGTKVTPGSTVAINLGANVTLGSIPAGNEAVKSITRDPSDPNTVLITFADPWPTTSGQGVISLNFTVNEVDGSAADQISWAVDGEESSVDVIVKNGGDNFANVNDNASKYISNNGDLNRFVTYDSKTGKVTVSPAIIGSPVQYTLSVDTKEARATYAISDVLPTSMGYIVDSFSATQTTWDENGLNRTGAPVDFAPSINGNNFVGQLDLPGPSQTVIKYSASVADEAARAALEAQLQAEADKINKDNGGNYRVDLKNSATLGDVQRQATLRLSGNITGNVSGLPGPSSSGLKKSADWGSQNVTPSEDGILDPAVDITYTVKTDLTSYDGSNVKKTLKDNVIVSDTLPTQATWNVDDPEFLKVTGIELTKVAPVAAAAFAGDAYVGMYFIEGQVLKANIGKGNALNVSIGAKAKIHSVGGLKKMATDIPGDTKYELSNRATWVLNSEYQNKTDGYTNNVHLVAHQDNEDGFNAPDYFSKISKPAQVHVEPGQSAPVTYTFTVGAGKGIDLTKSSIVDYVDTKIFDVTDLDKISEGITAQYAWWVEMTGGDFLVTRDGEGNIVIELSESGRQKVEKQGIDKQFVLNLTLNTKPVTGKQTLQIKNKATLFGEDDKALFWSEATTDATSYGDEAEIRKSVRDTPNAAWTQNLRAEMDAGGNLVQPQYVYNVALLPHGNYTGVKIFDVVDVLPAGTKFIGFVADGNVDSQTNPSTSVQDLKGNVQARYDEPTDAAPAGTVVLYQKPSTVLDASQGAASVNVLVEIVDFKADVAIDNIIGNTKASITPTDGYPLSVSKVDSEDITKVISDDKARFQILNADGDVVVDNVMVRDGALRVASGDEVKNVTVPAPGAYTVKEITAPIGYQRSNELLEVTVNTDGSSQLATFYNQPSDEPVKNYAVGDYVWVDENKDGIQGDQEVLEGVKVTLLNGEGETIAETVTNAEGRYIFDELPAGEYQMKFELTEVQAAKYEFTAHDSGDDDAKDSDADPTTGLTIKFTLDDSNTALTKDYSNQDVKATEGIDPTWDAGVVLKPAPKVSVGDYVWVDENKDGIQDDVEPGIEGVVLTITGPDGKPVVDVNGNVVEATATDENGYYTFENLPVLEEGQSYTVTIDQDASKEPLAPYVPTIENGADRDTDSSTWEAKSEGLTHDGDRDPTLDFGFVLKPEPTVEPTDPSVEPSGPTEEPSVEPTDPSVEPSGPTEEPSEDQSSVPSDEAESQPDAEDGELADTGFAVIPVVVIGLLLAIAGVLLTRRTARRHG